MGKLSDIVQQYDYCCVQQGYEFYKISWKMDKNRTSNINLNDIKAEINNCQKEINRTERVKKDLINELQKKGVSHTDASNLVNKLQDEHYQQAQRGIRHDEMTAELNQSKKVFGSSSPEFNKIQAKIKEFDKDTQSLNFIGKIANARIEIMKKLK